MSVSPVCSWLSCPTHAAAGGWPSAYEVYPSSSMTVPAHCSGRDPGRRRRRAIQPVTVFSEVVPRRSTRWPTSVVGVADGPVPQLLVADGQKAAAVEYWAWRVTRLRQRQQP
jgi:hypothetical protein